MERLPRIAAAALCAAFLAGCGGAIEPTPKALAPQGAATRVLREPLGPRSIVSGGRAAVTLCPATSDSSQASCLGSARMMTSLTSAFPDSVDGLTPADLSSIYGYPAPGLQPSNSPVVGVVVAYDNANAESDLSVYRSYFGLPACTSGNGCFQKVGAAAPSQSNSQSSDAKGKAVRFSVSAHPASTSGGWAAESDSDVEIVSAVCGNCQIVLAEAASNNINDLAAAVNAATGAGATVINASFGANESPWQTNLESAFEPAPVKVVAAAGDSAGQVLFPADATNVIAVAGTTLNVSGTTMSQSLWQNSGGGCSRVFAAPPYQPGWCTNRSIADVAGIADPNTGLAFYDSGMGGWGIIGGTSVAAPVITAMLAMSGDAVAGSGAQPLYRTPGQYMQVGGAGTIAGLGLPIALAAF
jgi:hypothetical protein